MAHESPSLGQSLGAGLGATARGGANLFFMILRRPATSAPLLVVAFESAIDVLRTHACCFSPRRPARKIVARSRAVKLRVAPFHARQTRQRTYAVFSHTLRHDDCT